MDLQQALTKATTVTEFIDIFKNDVKVTLGWVNDQVTIDGYQGSVTTDFIARRIVLLNQLKTEDSATLRWNLAVKVFFPLKNLVESPENQCSLYQLTALTRIFWTWAPAQQFGRSIALKHAMVLRILDHEDEIGKLFLN